jgi:hypothetical protein
LSCLWQHLDSSSRAFVYHTTTVVLYTPVVHVAAWEACAGVQLVSL